MAFLNSRDKQNITAAISDAERHTSGELVTVIARSSDRYLHVRLLWPALLALLLPGIVLIGWPRTPALDIYAAQVALFAVLQFAMFIPAVGAALVPKRLKHLRASRLARAQFFAQGLHLTENRTGVLLFVSIAERYVEIIADDGIDAGVPDGTWDSVVAAFVADIRVGRIADGFLTAIAEVGHHLREHCPATETSDELPNRLVEL